MCTHGCVVACDLYADIFVGVGMSMWVYVGVCGTGILLRVSSSVSVWFTYVSVRRILSILVHFCVCI